VTSSARFWREEKDRFFIRVRLTPRGGRDALEGVETLSDGQSVMKARVRAAPEKGLANAALEKLVADALGVPKSAVSVAAGGTSRIKTVRVSGSADELIPKLRALG
jgi:uncharacterized protein YggU (UPF0235/DUF167 family)